MNQLFSWLVIIGAATVLTAIYTLLGLFLGWLAREDRERWRASINQPPARLK